VKFQATHKLVTYLLVLAAFATLASTGALPMPHALIFPIGWALSWPVDPGGRAAAVLDRAAVAPRVAVLGVLGASGWAVWRRLPEPDLLPVLDLLLVLIGYKLFYRRGNRDYLHIYVLSFLLVLAASALAGTFLFAAAFAVYVVLATWTLILFHLRREMEENYLVKHSAQAPSQKVGVARILNSRRVVGGAFFAATGVVALGVFAGAAVTFAVIPRVGTGFVFGAARPTENLIGFSDDVTLGHYGVLSSRNQAVALRAVVPHVTAAAASHGETARDHFIEHLYWRGTVYDRYERGHWTRSHDPRLRTVLERGGPHTFVREPAFEAPGPAPRHAALGRAERQEIDVVGLSVPVVFAMDRPFAIELPPGGAGGMRLVARWSGEVALHATPFGAPGAGDGSEGDAAEDVHRGVPDGVFGAAISYLGTRYVAYSTDARAPAGASLPTEELPADLRQAYLALPRSLSPRVAALAERLTADKPTAPARAAALFEWLRATHEYSVELPRRPSGVDPLEDFLFDQRVGHCEYFASAMVVLLRASGIPARYVNGYLGGEWNDIGSYITVRDNRAHSWAEAYLGPAGWVRVDATPAAAGPVRAGRLRQLLESADFYWSRWVVGYDLDRQLDLARRLGRRLGLAASRTGEASEHLPGWALVVVAVAALVIVASRRWSRGVPRPARARKPPSGAEPAVYGVYRRALDRLARAGLPRRPTETPREYAGRVARAAAPGSDLLDELTELYTAARFGDRPVDGEALKAVSRRLVQLGSSPAGPA